MCSPAAHGSRCLSTAEPTPRDSAIFGENWYATSLFTDCGLKFIDEAREEKKPFFLYLPFKRRISR